MSRNVTGWVNKVITSPGMLLNKQIRWPNDSEWDQTLLLTNYDIIRYLWAEKHYQLMNYVPVAINYVQRWLYNSITHFNTLSIDKLRCSCHELRSFLVLLVSYDWKYAISWWITFWCHELRQTCMKYVINMLGYVIDW